MHLIRSPFPLPSYPIKSFDAQIPCFKEDSDDIYFQLNSGNSVGINGLNYVINELHPNRRRQAFSPSSEEKLREVIPKLCLGFASTVTNLPESEILDNVSEIPTKRGENRTTFHNAFATELSTNVDAGRYGLIIGGRGDNDVGSWDFEFVFLTEFLETIKEVEVPVIGWLVALILIIVYFIIYIIVHSLVIVSIVAIILYESTNDNPSERVVTDAVRVLFNLQDLTTT